MNLAAAQVRLLSALFDEAEAVAADELDEWLARLKGEAAELREPLANMLARRSRDGSDALLTRGGFANPLGETDLTPGDMVGPYRLLDVLGEGGMGAVWRAEQADGRMNRTVALKLPRIAMPQPMLRAHFQRERDILAALDHPGIATLFDAGVSVSGQPYLAMQFVPGAPLTRHCDELRLGVSARVRLFLDLLDAVQHAHSALVIHRDIKPGNVFVSGEGRVMLLDFGIGKLISPPNVGESDGAQHEFTELYGRALTPDYASPEQILGKPVGTGSDIYSLGVVLYELLCGERPYRLKRGSRAELEEAILEQEVTAPSKRVTPQAALARSQTARALARTLRGDLDAVVRMAMAREPSARYSTAQAFESDLRRWLRKDPVQAQPDRVRYRAGRFLARRWRTVAVTALVALAVVGAAVYAQHEAIDARAQRAQALEEAAKAKAVTQFLQDVLTQNSLQQQDPGAARQRTAEQLLDDGAKQIVGRLNEAPKAKLELLETMAQMYSHLRLPAKGAELLELRANQSESLYGADDPRTVSAWQGLALYAYANNVMSAGEPAMKHLAPHLARLEASANAADRRQAADLVYAQLFSMFRSDVKGALPVADRLAAMMNALPGRRDVQEAAHWLGVEHILGVTYFQNLRLAQAEAHFGASDRLLAQMPPRSDRQHPSHPAWHAMLLDLMGRHGEAQALFARANALERHGDANAKRMNAWVLNAWVTSLLDNGDVQQALALATTGAADGHGNAGQLLAGSTNALLAQASALSRVRRAGEALQKIRAAEALWRAENPKEPVTFGYRERADALLALGRLDDAEAVLKQFASQLRTINEFTGLRSRGYHIDLVRLKLARGDAKGARAALETGREALYPQGAGERERLRVEALEAQIRLAERLEGSPPRH